ncbi:NUDIX hydrolase [Sphingomonas sp. Mn802worker]|uniref:NUDIX hydrolase n=1 Tax=Sphingomonas sp. Mn802worker TaxID=629773 RepID=UPI00037C3E16|nr:NUDIX domain-containing protein [Sphingomonas sp. Mn802worker]
MTQTDADGGSGGPSHDDVPASATYDEGAKARAVPAATLVIFRERSGGPPELLMVERAQKMAFAAGAMVFPGGRVDPGDHALAQTLGADDDGETAARIAAIRETIEEAGLPVGLTATPSLAALTKMRRALHAGTAFADVLRAAGVTLDLDTLVPFARWRPAHRHRRIFDTRFYLARLPGDAPEACVDQTENVRLAWASAAGVLADADAGRLSIIFPTRRNLERLAQFASFDAAVAHARATPLRVVTPWSERRGGEDRLCIPEDLGYPVTSEATASAMRG